MDKNKSKTSFIYFDVGGVAIKDFSGSNKWELFKQDLGVTPEKLSEFNQIWQENDRQLSLDLDVDVLVQRISQKLNLNLPFDFSAMKQFIDRFEPNESIWPIIYQLKTQANIGLLTNMYPDMLRQIQKASLLPKVTWDVIVDSSAEMLRKPEPEIYSLAETRADVKPEHILFIDNQLKNLIVPQQRGWQTFLYDSADYEKSTNALIQFFHEHKILL